MAWQSSRPAFLFDREASVFVDKLTKSGKLDVIPTKEELPDASEVQNEFMWQRLVDKGRATAQLALVNAKIDAENHIPGDLAQYLDSALLSDSVAANLIQPYLELVRGSANDADVPLLEAQTLADADFFYLYLGSLTRRNQARARDVADGIYRALVWSVIYAYENWVFSAKSASAADTLDTQMQEIRMQHIELINACHSAPQPACPSSHPLALSYYAFYVLGHGAPPISDAMLSAAPMPSTLLYHDLLSRKLRVTASLPTPPSEVLASIPDAGSSTGATHCTRRDSLSVSEAQSQSNLEFSGLKNDGHEAKEGGGEVSRDKRARKVTEES